MNNIKLIVETTDDKSQVVIGAQTTAGGDTEDRNYFLDPYQAVEIANAILHAAADCGVEIKMETTGISAEKRARLIQRTAHVIRSLGNRKLMFTAAQVVDTILTEVL